MIVGIQRGLEGIKHRLEQRGYKVVYTDEYRHPIDAFIFSGFNTYHPFSSFSPTGSIGSAFGNIANISHGSRYSGEIIEINAAEKSFDEIESMLIMGRHGNLF